MVGHFDAVEILVRYVTSPCFPYNSISVKILVAPPTDSALLPWSQLRDFLPELDNASATTGTTFTNNEIHEFLEKNIASSSKAKAIKVHAENVQKWSKSKQTGNEKKIEQALNRLRVLTKGDDRVMDKVEALLQKSQKKDKTYYDVNSESDEIQALLDSLCELSGRDRFFISLSNLSF